MTVKFTELPEVTTLDDVDVVASVHIADGPNGSKKITVANLRTLIIGTLMSAHLAAADPHPGYRLESEAISQSDITGLTTALSAKQNISGLPINPTNYGADPTGVSDCSTAILNAAAAAPNGSVIKFPPGVYRLAAQIHITKSICVLIKKRRFDFQWLTLQEKEDLITWLLVHIGRAITVQWSSVNGCDGQVINEQYIVDDQPLETITIHDDCSYDCMTYWIKV